MSADYVPGQGLPVARPIGSTVAGPDHQVRDQRQDLRGPNTSPPSDSLRPAERRLSREALARLEQVMPARDHRVLELVDQHKFLTTLQLQQFAFTDHQTPDSAARTTRRVLLRLQRSALLRPLQRRIGGVRSGSAAKVWQLTPGAARLLRADGATHRVREPSLRFMAHCLAVADVHLAVRALVPHLAESVDVQIESAAWRWFTGPGGERRSVQPDLGVRVRTQHFDDRWLIEVDLGTESLPTLLQKARLYESYRASGIEQDRHRSFPLVLWVLTQPGRADRLRHHIARTPSLTPALHRIVTTGDLATELHGVLS